ncbi:phospholipase D-like domain-containing protein [Klebsiella pneumoniae]|uniref:phospholipase D-like domain-containing protein n=1 Tax=Klebsiella pneumoniae TaxID=573 RepID=UPI002B4663B6|nr:phospholipase D-like domain-containing protein [Klebsiella pneumoniae]
MKVRLTDAYKIHHDKVIIIDQNTVETGSFNFTKAAEYTNSENALVLNDATGGQRLSEHWVPLGHRT